MTDIDIQYLRDKFTEHADREFIREARTGRCLSYGQVEEMARRCSGWLRAQGVMPQDNVAIALPNVLEFIVLYFGCMQCGAVAVPINPLLAADEAEYILKNSQARILLTERALAQRWRLESRSLPAALHVLPLYGKNDVEAGVDFLGQLDRMTPDNEKFLGRLKDEHTAAIIYTSGTTGKPKGTMISFHNVIRNGIVFGDRLGMSTSTRFLNILSLAHMAGWYNLTFIPAVVGASVVLGDVFNAETSLRFWDTVVTNQVNSLWLVPTIMSILLTLDRGDRGAIYAKEHIRMVLAGTAPVPLKLKQDFERKYGVPVYENYGISETTFIATNGPSTPFKALSVGRLLPGCEMRVIDLDSGHTLGTGQEGELAVKTSYLMKGYFNNESEPFELHEGTHFLTGDIGNMDAEGYVFITGRKKDLIIRGGINISPRELEEVLQSNAAIEEAAVIGVKDEVYGESIAAVLKLKEEFKGQVSERDITKYCLERLAPFKCPNLIYFIYELPRNPAGKIQKNKLRAIVENLQRKPST